MSRKTLKQYAVIHTGHELSRHTEFHFLKQNCVQNHPCPYCCQWWSMKEGYGLKFISLTGPHYRQWSPLFSRELSEELLKLDPWLCILLRNGHALWSIRRIPHLYGRGKSWVRLCRARKPVSKPATSSHFSVKLVDIQVYILTQAPESASSLRIWTEMPGRPSTCRGPLFPPLPGLQRKPAPCQCLEMTVNMHVTTEAERSNAHDALSDAASWVMELAWGSKRGRGCWIYPWFDHLNNPQCKCIRSTPGCSVLIEKASGEPQNESVHTTS